MVDDEPNLLAGYLRTVGRTHAMTIAVSGAAALEVIASSGPFAVVITDMRMPEMNGLEFIDAARPRARDSIFMMLTGDGDRSTAVDAINRGHIFRFLNKPCTPELLDTTIRAGLRQYELITSERVLLRDTLTGTVRVLTEALELGNPFLGPIQFTLQQVHRQICSALGIVYDWQMTVAASLCLIGLVTLSGKNLDFVLSDENLDQAAKLGHHLIKNLPRLSSVAEMILHHRECGSLPAELKGLTSQAMETVGAQLLRFSADAALLQHRLGSLKAAVAEMKASGAYDKRLLSALKIEDIRDFASRRQVPNTPATIAA
jgi:CheY-like chemotaxis protein